METIGRDLREMQRTPLAPAHVAALEAVGVRRHYRAGEMITQVGTPIDRFIFVEAGEVEVADPFTGERLVPSTIGPTQFVGEIALLSGGTWSLPMRAARDTDVIEVPRTDMLRLMAAVPEMSDIVITVLAARRRRQLEAGDGTLVLIGEDDHDNGSAADLATLLHAGELRVISGNHMSAVAVPALGEAIADWLTYSTNTAE